MDASRKKALEVVKSLADEALRNRWKAKRTPPPVKVEEKREDELSDEDTEQLAQLYERETANIGRA